MKPTQTSHSDKPELPKASNPTLERQIQQILSSTTISQDAKDAFVSGWYAGKHAATA